MKQKALLFKKINDLRAAGSCFSCPATPCGDVHCCPTPPRIYFGTEQGSGPGCSCGPFSCSQESPSQGKGVGVTLLKSALIFFQVQLSAAPATLKLVT